MSRPSPRPAAVRYSPAPRITALGADFYDEVSPAPFPRHELRFRNQRWADRVGLGGLDPAAWEAHFARFEPLQDNLERPLALRYHGHQFDVYNPRLGDGRGFLLAELEDADGRLLDLGTKGSGTTPWSRGGDGRLTLKGGVREVLATEMLEALGVETSRSFSLFETGESLLRGDEPSPTRSAALVRLSHSHMRFGTFQRLAYLGRTDGLDRLLTYCLRNYYPWIDPGEPDRARRFLTAVAKRTAELVAAWMISGFVHGVLNSDNMNVTGESFDYGPWRFLPTYDRHFVAAYFDHEGLYAYGRQPRAVFRNLIRLGEALRRLTPDLAIAPALASFEAVAEEASARHVLFRLGLAPSADTDPALVSALFGFLEESGAGYDRTFFDLYGGLGRARPPGALAPADGYRGPAWDVLRGVLALYTPARDAPPAYFEGERPCTLLIDEVETVWDAIARRDDWGPFRDKVREIREMGAALAAPGDAAP